MYSIYISKGTVCQIRQIYKLTYYIELVKTSGTYNTTDVGGNIELTVIFHI